VASEIKAIFANENIKADIDEEAMYHYLSFLAVPAPFTLYK